MGERVTNQAEFQVFLQERQLASRLRDAMGFCKDLLQITHTTDRLLSYEDRINFEKCLTENYLLKRGMNYFGNRDLIYLDMHSTADVERIYGEDSQ